MYLNDNGHGTAMKYSPGVLVGNWQEYSCQQEEELKAYQARKEQLSASTGGRSAAMAASTLAGTSVAEALLDREALTAKQLTALTHITTTDSLGVARYGAPMTIVNTKHNAALAIDLGPSVAPRPRAAALTCSSAATVPQVRSTWVLEPCRDENNAAYRCRAVDHDVVHYGQRVRIANEVASAEGFYYVHAELGTGRYASQPQRAIAALGACADNVFVVCKPGAKREAVDMVGEPVPLGAPVVLMHSITNRPLHCGGVRAKTSGYGMEWAVTCDYANGGNFACYRSSTVTQEENIFCFAAGETGDGPMLRRARVSTTMAETMPVTCGDGIEEILGTVREAVLAVGGRLGFRAVSCALNVACAEQRRTDLDRLQLQSFVKGKLGLELSPLQLDALIKRFDKSGNNRVRAQELLDELRGNMTPERVEAVALVYNQLVMEGEGSVQFTNMFNLYRVNAVAHPDVADGIVSSEQVILDFERSWPGRVGTKVGTVTLDMFMTYYNDISPTIPDDDRFFAMLRRCWAVPPTDDYLKGVPRRTITVTHHNDTKETIHIPDTLVFDGSNRKAVERLLVRHGVRDVKDFTVSP